MIGAAGRVPVFAYRRPVDLRKGFEGLSALVRAGAGPGPAVGGAVPVHESAADDGEGAAVRRHRARAVHQEAGTRPVRGAVGRLGAGEPVADADRARPVPAGQPARRQDDARTGAAERKRSCHSRARGSLMSACSSSSRSKTSDCCRKHARHLRAGAASSSRSATQELAKELARLKELSPEQLEFEIARQAEQLAKLRHKVFGESSERRPSPHPPDAERPRSRRQVTGRRASGCRRARCITVSPTNSASARPAAACSRRWARSPTTPRRSRWRSGASSCCGTSAAQVPLPLQRRGEDGSGPAAADPGRALLDRLRGRARDRQAPQSHAARSAAAADGARGPRDLDADDVGPGGRPGHAAGAQLPQAARVHSGRRRHRRRRDPLAADGARQQQEVVGLVPDDPRRRLVHARAQPLGGDDPRRARRVRGRGDVRRLRGYASLAKAARAGCGSPTASRMRGGSSTRSARCTPRSASRRST
jgi:hypothetical protein